MHEKLDYLAALIRANGYTLDLYPPLSREEITTILHTHGVLGCEEIMQLYTWANGTDEATSIGMFRDARFISLARTLESREYVPLYEPGLPCVEMESAKILPFADIWGYQYGIYCDTIHKLHHPIISISEDFGIAFKHFDAMLDTCIGWWSQTPPEIDTLDMRGPIWYQWNSVDGDPFYIDRLNLSV